MKSVPKEDGEATILDKLASQSDFTGWRGVLCLGASHIQKLIFVKVIFYRIRMGKDRRWWRSSKYTSASWATCSGTLSLLQDKRCFNSSWRIIHGLCWKWCGRPGWRLPRRQRWPIRLRGKRQMGSPWRCKLGQRNVPNQLLYRICPCQQFHWLDQPENVWWWW